MSDAFDFLGLDREADERAIKRAYAQALKRTRPESDPVGFQALNEAYHRALDRVRERAEAPRRAAPAPFEPQAMLAMAADAAPAVVLHDPMELAAPAPLEPLPAAVLDWTDEASSRVGDTVLPDPPERVQWEAPPVPAQVAFHSAPANERFVFPAFFDALAAQALQGDASRLRDWLQRQPALWSLTTKAQAGTATMAALQSSSTPMPDRCFDAILAFFDLDHVLAGQDALKLGRLRRRLHVEWLLLRGERQEFAAELRSAKPPVNLPPDRLARFLSGPFRWHSVLLQALPPNQPSEVAAFLRFLEQARVQQLPPAFDARRMRFWRRAGDRGAMSWPRVAVGAARCLAITCAVALIDVMEAIGTGVATVTLLPLAWGISMLWAMFIAWAALSQWQNRPQEAFASAKRDAGFWLRLAFIPALCAVALGVRRLPALIAGGTDSDAPMVAAAAIVVLAIAFATRRYRRRADSPPIAWTASVGWRWILILPALKALVVVAALVAYYAEAGAALAGAIWIADLRKQWRRLSGAA